MCGSCVAGCGDARTDDALSQVINPTEIGAARRSLRESVACEQLAAESESKSLLLVGAKTETENLQLKSAP